MRTGSVFCWKNYPFQKDGKTKDRWFVCLGESKLDPLETNPAFIAIIAPTTTAQVEFYEEGRERYAHLHIKFEPLSEMGFTRTCVLDLSYTPESSSVADVQQYIDKGEIQVKGVIPENFLRDIYAKICSPSSAYSPKLKLDIHNNLNAIGIIGLPLPEKRKRKR